MRYRAVIAIDSDDPTMTPAELEAIVNDAAAFITIGWADLWAELDTLEELGT